MGYWNDQLQTLIRDGVPHDGVAKRYSVAYWSAMRESEDTNTNLYMIVERYKNGDAIPVYRRFRDHGRLAPAGLTYVSSWVDTKLETCYQLMETDDLRLLDQWMAKWQDIVDFEVHPVITSAEAAKRVLPKL